MPTPRKHPTPVVAHRATRPTAERDRSRRKTLAYRSIMGRIAVAPRRLLDVIVSLFSSQHAALLKRLVQKVQAMQPGQWTYKRSVENGGDVGILDAAFADLVAELRRAEDDLEEEVAERTAELQKTAAQDRAMLSEFISVASHQIRIPLSSIHRHIELLQGDEKKDMSAPQRAHCKEIEKESKRMANLLEALLHVAKLEENGVYPNFQQVDLREIAEQIAEEWTPMAKEKGVSFTVALPPAGTLVRTDPLLLQIIVQNFLNNAFKYTPRGKEVQFRIRREQDKFILSVQDTGIGIPTGQQRRVFEKFFRGQNVRQSDTDGTGLGLYTSKTIASELGGSIFFESQEGRGTTFTLVMPAGRR